MIENICDSQAFERNLSHKLTSLKDASMIMDLFYATFLMILLGCSSPESQENRRTDVGVTTPSQVITEMDELAQSILKAPSLSHSGNSGTVKSIAILPFVAEGTPTLLGESLARDLTIALVEETSRQGQKAFQVVSREHLDKLLAEQSLSLSDAFEQGPISALGHLRVADFLITGSIVTIDKVVYLTVEVLRVADGVVVTGKQMDLGPLGNYSVPRPNDELASTRMTVPVGDLNSIIQVENEEDLLLARLLSPFLHVDELGMAMDDAVVVLQIGRGNTPTPWPDISNYSRRPVDLCLVLDTSGSMGDHSRLEEARRAAHEVLDYLQPVDRFCLITFNSSVKIPLRMESGTNEEKRKAHLIVDAITASGQTNYEAALRELKGHFLMSPALSRTHLAIFISDGEPTEGIRDEKTLASLAGAVGALGVSLNTLGVGRNLRIGTLQSIATSGRGRLHLAWDVSALSRLLTDLVGESFRPAALNAQLAFTPAPGVYAVKIGHGWTLNPDGSLVAELGLLLSGEEVVRIIHLGTDRNNLPGNRFFLGTTMLTYLTPSERRIVESRMLEVTTTDDSTIQSSSMDLQLACKTHLADLRSMLLKVYDLVRLGKDSIAAMELSDGIKHHEHLLAMHSNQNGHLVKLRELLRLTKDHMAKLERGRLTIEDFGVFLSDAMDADRNE